MSSEPSRHISRSNTLQQDEWIGALHQAIGVTTTLAVVYDKTVDILFAMVVNEKQLHYHVGIDDVEGGFFDNYDYDGESL